MRLGLIIVGLLVVSKPFAQVVQVIDPLEYMPIADVVITDAKCTKAVKTNMLGEALIEAFSAKDSLIFEHPYYNTCLLYTSPSPRDRQKSRMPSSA